MTADSQKSAPEAPSGDAGASISPAEQTKQPTLFGRPVPVALFKVLLLLATTMWGLSFFIMKNALDVIPPSWLIGIRFFLCGIILAIIFHKRMRACFNRDHLFHGTLIGCLLFIAYWFQTVGLDGITPGKNAFLTATYCVIVPFVWWVIARRKPTLFNILAAFGCIIGIGLVSLSADAFTAGGALMGRGDAFTLICAFFFALHIVYVAKVNPGRDIYVLTAYQFLVSGLLGMIVGACTETLPAALAITPQLIGEMAYLTIFASLLALLIQNVSLQYVPPAQVSLILCLESVFGVLFSVMFYGETLTIRVLMGFAIIFAALVVSETGALLKAKLTPSGASRRMTNDQPDPAPAESGTHDQSAC